jgi:carboxyl-terminal processing protease
MPRDDTPRVVYRILLLALTTLVTQMVVAFVTTQTPPEIAAHDRELAQRMLSQVHQTLRQNYYDPTFHGIDVDERFKKYSAEIKSANTFQTAYRTIESFLIGLNDSHTIFLPPPNSNRVTYGFRIKIIGDQCFATGLRPASDAAQKLRLGDQILSLDGYGVNREDLWQLEYYLDFLPPKSTTDFTLRDISGKVRRENVKADVVALSKYRPSSPSLSRMHFESWQHNIRSRSAEQDDVFFWKFASFNEDEPRIDHMLSEARKHRALVLDLRENGGGSQNNLFFMLGGLFDHDITIAKEVTRKGAKPLEAKSRGGSAFLGQLIVLIDSRSASASEILARVVQLEHRGVTIGDRSAGSVMAARFFPLSPGVGMAFDYGVEVTVADLIMADGKSLEHVGITPDEVVLPTADDLATGRDPVLARAAALAGTKLDAIAAGKQFPIEWPSPEPLQ